MSEAETQPEAAPKVAPTLPSTPSPPPNEAMGLKRFHIVFIVASVAISVGFGAWAVRDYSQSENTINLGLGIASFAVAGGLLVYGRWFLTKLKGLSV